MKQINIITHNGIFHSDEVFAVAFLQFLYQESKVIFERTREKEVIAKAQQNKDTFVLDIGGVYQKEMRNFDHHQKEYQGEQSSFGLLIDSLPKHQVKSLFPYIDAFQYFKKQLVKPIDKWDNNTNGIIQIANHNDIYSLQRIINSFNQEIPFGLEQERAFVKAVDFAGSMIKKEIDAANDSIMEQYLCDQYLSEGQLVIRKDKAISKVFFKSFKGWAKKKGLRYLLLPIPNEKLNQDYIIYSTQPQKHKLPEDSLSTFRHKAGFMILFKNYENAIRYFDKL